MIKLFVNEEWTGASHSYLICILNLNILFLADEDWNSSPLEEPLFAKPTANDHPLPRIRRQDSGVDSGSSPVQTSPEKDYYGRQDQHVVNPTNFKRQNSSSNNNNNVISPNLRDKYSDRNVALVQPRPRNSELQAKQSAPMTTSATAPTEYRRKPVDVRQRTPSPNGPGALVVKETPRERFKDAKEKFLLMEKERVDEQRSALKKCLERQRKDNVIRAAVRGSCGGDWPRSRDSDDENIAQDACSRNRYDYDDCFEDDRRSKNVRRSNRSRESLDNDYNNDGYPKPISSRRSRNSQVIIIYLIHTCLWFITIVIFSEKKSVHIIYTIENDRIFRFWAKYKMYWLLQDMCFLCYTPWILLNLALDKYSSNVTIKISI